MSLSLSLSLSLCLSNSLCLSLSVCLSLILSLSLSFSFCLSLSLSLCLSLSLSLCLQRWAVIVTVRLAGGGRAAQAAVTRVRGSMEEGPVAGPLYSPNHKVHRQTLAPTLKHIYIHTCHIFANKKNIGAYKHTHRHTHTHTHRHALLTLGIWLRHYMSVYVYVRVRAFHCHAF